MTVRVRSEGLSAEIATLGAELQRLTTVAGEELLSDGDPRWWRGRAPILFPVIGLLQGGHYRIGDRTYAMPKHGFARNSTFEIAEATESAATLRLSASDETRAIYPFEFQLDIGFALTGATLTVAATVANLGDAPMPASFGFHPALRWPLPFGRPRPAHRIIFEADEPAPIRRINADGLLTPAQNPTPVAGNRLDLRDDLFVDDALIFDAVRSRRVSYGTDDGPQVDVAFDDFPVLGVWTKPGAPFLCVEPWHGLPDPAGYTGEFRDKPGSFEVAPGTSRRMAMTISLDKR